MKDGSPVRTCRTIAQKLDQERRHVHGPETELTRRRRFFFFFALVRTTDLFYTLTSGEALSIISGRGLPQRRLSL